DIFSPATVQRWLGHLRMLLENIIRDPQTPVTQLELLADSERDKALVEWNNTRTDYPRENCIHEIFEQQARLSPNAPAVVFRKEQLAYAELNRRANALAGHL